MAFAPTSKGDLRAGRRGGSSFTAKVRTGSGWEGGAGQGDSWGRHAALHKASLVNGFFPMRTEILWFRLLVSRQRARVWASGGDDPLWDWIWPERHQKAQPQDLLPAASWV